MLFLQPWGLSLLTQGDFPDSTWICRAEYLVTESAELVGYKNSERLLSRLFSISLLFRSQSNVPAPVLSPALAFPSRSSP